MGGCAYCNNLYDNYFNAFFNSFKLKKSTDLEFTEFIESLILKKTNSWGNLKSESKFQKEDDTNTNTSNRKEKQKQSTFESHPESRKSGNPGEVFTNHTHEDDISSTELINNMINSHNIKDVNVIKEGNEVNLELIQENLHKFADELVEEVLNKFCFYDNLTVPVVDELFPDNDEKHFLNDYLIKRQANKYFEYYQKQFKKQGKSLQYIASLLFFTKTSFSTIAKYLNKLFMLFFNIEILQEENNCIYINMNLIKEVCEIYIKMCSCNCLDYISEMMPEEQDSIDFLTYYNQVFASKIIAFFVENYFEFNFSQEISLAYFAKIIYVKVETEATVRNSLLETYLENKNFNEKVLKEIKKDKR